jgi:ABC-2 type transport system ATP-binding protein
VRLSGGAEQLAEVVRSLDAEDLSVTDFRLHAPTLDDVFLAKTGRKLEGGEPSAEPQAVPA